ncbi:MAG: hypothetical protein ACKPKO_63580, partial [Candidatus Fonsibacter sp.]
EQSTPAAEQITPAAEQITPAAELDRITIGPIRYGYCYTKIEPGLWRGSRSAAGYPVPADNYVLFLCQQDGLWLAVHADASAPTITDVLEENRIVFGSHDNITTSGEHKWDTWNGEDWGYKDNFYFKTTRT